MLFSKVYTCARIPALIFSVLMIIFTFTLTCFIFPLLIWITYCTVEFVFTTAQNMFCHCLCFIFICYNIKYFNIYHFFWNTCFWRNCKGVLLCNSHHVWLKFAYSLCQSLCQDLSSCLNFYVCSKPCLQFHTQFL